MKHDELPSSEDRIHYSAWDFAGQEVKESVHSFTIQIKMKF
jgi:hypothetical protein